MSGVQKSRSWQWSQASCVTKWPLALPVAVVADLAHPLVPRDLSKRYQEHIDDLRRFWRERFRQNGPSAV